jgi:hypothetical protein
MKGSGFAGDEARGAEANGSLPRGAVVRAQRELVHLVDREPLEVERLAARPAWRSSRCPVGEQRQLIPLGFLGGRGCRREALGELTGLGFGDHPSDDLNLPSSWHAAGSRSPLRGRRSRRRSLLRRLCRDPLSRRAAPRRRAVTGPPTPRRRAGGATRRCGTCTAPRGAAAAPRLGAPTAAARTPRDRPLVLGGEGAPSRTSSRVWFLVHASMMKRCQKGGGQGHQVRDPIPPCSEGPAAIVSHIRLTDRGLRHPDGVWA